MTGTPYTCGASNQILSTSSAGPYNFAVTHATAQQDSIVVAMGYNGGNNISTISLTDTQGNIYLPVTNNNMTNPAGWIFICPNQAATLTTAMNFIVNFGAVPTSAWGFSLIARGVPGGCMVDPTNILTWSSSITNTTPTGPATNALCQNSYAMAVITNGNGGGEPVGTDGNFVLITDEHPAGSQYLTVYEYRNTTSEASVQFTGSIPSALNSVGTAVFINPPQPVVEPSGQDVLAANVASVEQALSPATLW